MVVKTEVREVWGKKIEFSELFTYTFHFSLFAFAFLIFSIQIRDGRRDWGEGGVGQEDRVPPRRGMLSIKSVFFSNILCEKCRIFAIMHAKKCRIFLHRLALPSTSEMFGAFLTSATPTEEVIILSGNENGSFWVLLRLESNQGPSWYHTSPCWCSEASPFSTWNSVLASSTGGMLHSFRTSKNINCQESRDDML